MAHSMTGFARIEHASPFGTLSWELRSVNQRYLEPYLRLPDNLRELETPVRDSLRSALARGKVEVTLRFSPATGADGIQIDRTRAQALISAAEHVSAMLAAPAPIDPLAVLNWPGVMIADATDQEALVAEALALFQHALEQLREARAREGAALAALLEERLVGILEEVSTLKPLLPQMLAAQKQRIVDRCAELQLEPDMPRLEQELVLLAQKSDVAEELDRLCTHVDEVRRVLKQKGAIGRRLDFLMQELNREANTLGSKAIDPRSTQAAVNIKVLIEQMREQVQNLE